MYLKKHCTAALYGTYDHRPRCIDRASVKKHLRRIIYLLETVFRHIENADLICGTESVLNRAEYPEAGISISFKIQYRINHMLKSSWTRYGSFLRNMAYDKYSHIHFFCDLQKAACDLSYLGDRTRCIIYIGCCHGLYRVHYHHLCIAVFKRSKDIIKIIIAHKKKLIAFSSKPLASHLDLGKRFLTGNVKDCRSLI